MASYDLRHYDGVLAFGEVIRQLYLREAWTQRAWTFHEAADHEVFKPLPADTEEGDLVFVGNWGDDERTAELNAYLMEPSRDLRLRARIHGVRYPEHALAALRNANIEYGGWLPNHDAPKVFARFRFTVHVPRRPYAEALPGIPTIRVFEALACGIPLISAPWSDDEHLFTPGEDYLVARDGDEMRRHMRAVLHDRELARALSSRGLATLRARHTCGHRAEQLLSIVHELRGDA
jgi:spore maturation protein CgeB